MKLPHVAVTAGGNVSVHEDGNLVLLLTPFEALNLADTLVGAALAGTVSAALSTAPDTGFSPMWVDPADPMHCCNKNCQQGDTCPLRVKDPH